MCNVSKEAPTYFINSHINSWLNKKAYFMKMKHLKLSPPSLPKCIYQIFFNKTSANNYSSAHLITGCLCRCCHADKRSLEYKEYLNIYLF